VFGTWFEFGGAPGGWLERDEKSFLVNNGEMGFGLCLELGLNFMVDLIVFHGLVVQCGTQIDVYVGSSLVDFYGK
jgi:hypothetical protein